MLDFQSKILLIHVKARLKNILECMQNRLCKCVGVCLFEFVCYKMPFTGRCPWEKSNEYNISCCGVTALVCLFLQCENKQTISNKESCFVSLFICRIISLAWRDSYMTHSFFYIQYLRYLKQSRVSFQKTFSFHSG